MEPCDVECGENGECVKVEGESDRCECDKSYSYNGQLCEMDPTTCEFFSCYLFYCFIVSKHLICFVERERLKCA